MKSFDGAEIAVTVVEGDGSGVTVWLSHATGFCGACWRPVIDLLLPEVARLVVWDFRGHGRSQRSASPVSWWTMAGDVIEIRSAFSTDDDLHVGVGHSMGGAALVMAEITTPGSFDGLVLAEPILVGDPVHRTSYPLADVVRKRRNHFESRDRAARNFERKAPFSRWHADALAGYLEEGLVDRHDGLELSCAPDFEAEVYDTAHGHGAMRMLGAVTTPATVMVGDESDTYDVNWAATIARSMIDGEVVVVTGGDHFIPMEHPALVAREVDRLIDRLMGACRATPEPTTTPQ